LEIIEAACTTLKIDVEDTSRYPMAIKVVDAAAVTTMVRVEVAVLPAPSVAT
jgi:hypothetical protein